MRQKHIQPTVKTIKTQVRILPSPVQRIMNKPIFKKPIVTRSVRKVEHRFVHTVPVEKIVHVPTPVIHRVPVYLGTQTELAAEQPAMFNGQMIQGGKADAEAALLLRGGLLG